MHRSASPTIGTCPSHELARYGLRRRHSCPWSQRSPNASWLPNLHGAPFRLVLPVAVLLFAWLASAAPARADAIAIADAYVGGTVSHQTTSGITPVSSESAWYQKDRVGSASGYEIYGMYVTYSGNTLTVSIHSAYFDNVGSDCTSMGDLFISSDGYDMGSMSALYYTDTHTTGEDWEFVLVMDAHSGATSGNVSLHAITGGHSPTNGTINLSSVPTGVTFRADQEVTFTPGSGNSALATGAWAITDNEGDDDYLTYSIDMSGKGWSLLATDSAGLGFRWAMACGNDAIEGFASVTAVPEPGTLLLMGLGLAAGASGTRRLRRRARS